MLRTGTQRRKEQVGQKDYGKPIEETVGPQRYIEGKIKTLARKEGKQHM